MKNRKKAARMPMMEMTSGEKAVTWLLKLLVREKEGGGGRRT